MNPIFQSHTKKVESLFVELKNAPKFPFATDKTIPKYGGIYQFWEDVESGSEIVYVGRTRNFQGRFRGHVAKNHNSAGFAFKRMRARQNIQTSYTIKGGRRAILADPKNNMCFKKEIEKIRMMSVQLVKVDDPVDQYLLELYATLEAGLELSGFDTH